MGLGDPNPDSTELGATILLSLSNFSAKSDQPKQEKRVLKALTRPAGGTSKCTVDNSQASLADMQGVIPLAPPFTRDFWGLDSIQQGIISTEPITAAKNAGSNLMRLNLRKETE